MLFDPRRRAQGTSAVLVSSIAGGGKTHLVRQYVYDHLDAFPGGIFWVRAKSEEELSSGFWDIANEVDLQNLREDKEASSKDPNYFIEVVKTWFLQHDQWLLVLDGVPPGDSPSITKFIPDNKNCGLIYTSVSPNAEGDHHFLNPQVIRLPLLSAREAQNLFLQEIGKPNPTTEELRLSMELVQRMGLLPYVIHAVAKRLKATHEPLSKYVRSYLRGPQLSGLDPFQEVLEQLEKASAIEALNLIKILCFFNQHVPVEMISLGMHAPLGVPLRAYEPYIGHSLNNTFKILSSFALIERNEPDTWEPHSSQSSKSSKNNILLDSVDVIRLHSVVQDFFIDLLRTKEAIPHWLDQAAKLFCLSFDKANEKIKGRPYEGHVKDYRVYEIHGKMILKHAEKAEKDEKRKKSPKRLLHDLKRPIAELRKRLVEIEKQIHRRTPESSGSIGHGSGDGHFISIFDRTSSSSDADAETPAADERSEYSRWGMPITQTQIESPISLTQDIVRHAALQGWQASPNYPLTGFGHDGYETDQDETGSTTVGHPSPMVLMAREEPPTPGWQYIEDHRRALARKSSIPSHRTIREMEKHRYKDRAGAWRSVRTTVSDPRVNPEIAHGYFEPAEAVVLGNQNAGGHTPAELALNELKSGSPHVQSIGLAQQDQKPQRVGTDLIKGRPTYARAVSSNTATSAFGHKETKPMSIISRITNTFSSASSPAKSSLLSNSPRDRTLSLASQSQHADSIPVRETPKIVQPPYPLSDSVLDQLRYNDAQELVYPSITYNYFSQYPEDDFISPTRHDQMPAGLYEASAAPTRPPYQNYWSSPVDYSQPTRYPGPSAAWSAMNPRVDVPNNGPYASYPYTAGNNMSAYYPGDGYSSQPMSRDQSKTSNDSSQGRARRPSVAGTEPAPQIRGFSPNPATSYREYMSRSNTFIDDSSAATGRSTLGPGYQNAALVESVEQWESLHPRLVLPARHLVRSPLNPTVAPFYPSDPRMSFAAHRNGSIASAPLPTNISSPFTPPPPVTTPFYRSNPSLLGRNQSSSSIPAAISSASSPLPAISPIQSSTPPSLSAASTPRRAAFLTTSRTGTPSIPNSPLPPPLQPMGSPDMVLTAPDMSRTGSGGFNVGGQLIEFGDFPDKVDTAVARERADRLRRGPPPFPLTPMEEEEAYIGLGIRHG